MTMTPKKIIETLFPTLVQSATYANLIQHRIEAVEDKIASNIFAAALSDADLSIQTQVEVALLAEFPNLPFFGEEWKSSRNTKYLSEKTFKEGEPYVATLDPIDGTRVYLDGEDLYQVIFTVISREAIEAAVVLFPAYGEFVYALRGEGAYQGTFGQKFSEAKRWKLENVPSAIYVGDAFTKVLPELKKLFDTVFSFSDYGTGVPVCYSSAMLRRQLCGFVIREAQIIDGAALAFVVEEMGAIVETIGGKKMPPPGDYPELVLPGLIAGDSTRTVESIRNCVSKIAL